MAEHVQEALDAMVAPLRDLLDRGIFSHKELQAIVERRRQSEYLLRRITARKADFLRYIEEEQKLERLRELRTLKKRRQQKRNTDENYSKETKHIGDVHIIQHLHLLFVRAIRKFRSDLSLHLLHADFCKQKKSYSRLAKVYAEALQIFPRQTGLWIESASHEFFGPQRSIRNARTILQRGLRINPKAEDLWLEYFSLELHYAQTLKGRRQILTGSTLDNPPAEEDDDEQLEHKIVRIVYRNAMKEIPDSTAFRMRFLDICRRFPNMSSLVEEIQSPLLSTDPQAWIAKALSQAEKQLSDQRPNKRRQSQDPVVAIWKEALKALPTDAMRLEVVRFAKGYYNELNDADKNTDDVVAFLKDMPQATSSELVLELADFWESYDPKQAWNMLQDFCKSQSQVPMSVWRQWVQLSPAKDARRIWKQATKESEMGREGWNIWLEYFGSLLMCEEKEEDGLAEERMKTLERLLLLVPGMNDRNNNDDDNNDKLTLGQACCQYLNLALRSKDYKTARKIYTMTLFQSSWNWNVWKAQDIQVFVDKCLSLEAKDRVREKRLYDKAVELFQDSPLEERYRSRRNDALCNL